MGKQIFTVLVCGLLFESVLAGDAWALQPAALSGQTVRVRNAIQQIGTGTNALVAVRLKDKSVVSGSVSRIDLDSFQVTDSRTGAQTRVRFADVNRLAGANILSGDTVQYRSGIRAKLAKVAGVMVPGRGARSNGLFGTTLLLIGIVIGILIAVVVAKNV
jgi:hypothetical protein